MLCYSVSCVNDLCLKQISAMDLDREELLMKLGAARGQARAAWRLIDIEVAPPHTHNTCPQFAQTRNQPSLQAEQLLAEFRVWLAQVRVIPRVTGLRIKKEKPTNA
jgi:hypothetical protein